MTGWPALRARGVGRVVLYAGLGALGLFAVSQLVPLLVAAGPLMVLAIAVLLGLWVSARRPALPPPPPGALLARLRFEEAHALARAAGETAQVREHLAHTLPLPAGDLRASVTELYERLCQLEQSADEQHATHLDRDFLRELREHVLAAFESLWVTCRKLVMVQAQGVDLPPDHPGLVRLKTQVDELLLATREVQRAIVELTLTRGEQRLEQAGLALRVARRQAEALRALERVT